uniref:Thymidine kinase n=1 Tax=Cyprinid herpesvirus 1 TaxID=317858 RepID=A0A1P8C402_9VIRU|nr:thymidine kinase [Cyprinid herpesvirus 1]
MALELILGPMFAGKSTEMCRRLTRLAISGRQCLAVKFFGDTRYTLDAAVVTHNGDKYPALVACKLGDIFEDLIKADAVGIDEGQFFPDLFEVVHKLLALGKIVLVAALDGTYKQTPFEDVLKLIPHCESVVKLTAVCLICRDKEAPFTIRTSSGKDLVLIGGTEAYKSVCRGCLEIFTNSQ